MQTTVASFVEVNKKKVKRTGPYVNGKLNRMYKYSTLANFYCFLGTIVTVQSAYDTKFYHELFDYYGN